MIFATTLAFFLIAAATPALAALKLLNMNFNLCGNALYHDSNAYPLRRKTNCEFYTSSNRISLPTRKSSSSKYDGIIPLKTSIIFNINDYRCIYIQEKKYSKAEAMVFGRNDGDRIGYVSCQNQKIKGDTFVKDCFKSGRVAGGGGKCAKELPKGAPSCMEVSHCYTLGGLVKDAPKEFFPDQPLTHIDV